jgi:hypothetical protein
MITEAAKRTYGLKNCQIAITPVHRPHHNHDVKSRFEVRNKISYPFGCIIEPVACDDVNFSRLIVPFRLLLVFREWYGRNCSTIH